MEKKLTQKEIEEVEKICTEALREGIECNKEIDIETVRPFINWFYTKFADAKPPKDLIVVDNPKAACQLAMENGNDNPSNEIVFINTQNFWEKYYHTGVHLLGEDAGDLLEDLNICHDMMKNLHAILCCENHCIIIKYPIEIKLKDNDLEKFSPHCMDDYAIKYAGNVGSYVINNIDVPDYIVLTPAKDLSISQVLKEVDIDVRREGLAKILAVRPEAIAEISTILDEYKGDENWQDYQLLDVDFGDGKKRICLKMFDPASKKYCVERVPDNCKSVLEAKAFGDNESVDSYKEPILHT